MNILIVDDELRTLEEIEYYTKKYSDTNKCICCSNAVEALRQAEDTEFDIALLDIYLPEINGLELAELLRSKFPNIGIAFITAYNHYASEAFELNAKDYILKPIREERLYKTLDKLTDKKLDNQNTSQDISEIHILTFGRISVMAGGEKLRWSRYKSSEIFAYLLLHKGKWIHKEKICDELWADCDPHRALKNLQTAMWQLRKTMSGLDKKQISIDYLDNCYKLELIQGYYDVDEFENLCSKILKDGAIDNSEVDRVLSIYQGKYVEREDWQWAIFERELLDSKFRDIMTCILETWTKKGEYNKVFECIKNFTEYFTDEGSFEKYIPLISSFYGKEQVKALLKAFEEYRK